jgi:type 1 glutamine amidotransferase
MPSRLTLPAILAFLTLTLFPAPRHAAADESKPGEPGEKLKALIVDGQNNHNWKATTPILKDILESSGRFAVEVATTPAGGLGDGSGWDKFTPNFSEFDVVVSNYNGQLWPEPVRKALEAYVAGGGGFVPVHAANNSFPEWPEYNKMIGLGGWGGRNEKHGPYLRFRDGKVVLINDPGPGGSHGAYHEYPLETRAPEHPVMAGLPEKWMHTGDELYDRLRGPAENITVLATAHAAKDKGGTGEDEPLLMAIDYGKGRVFHTALGHDENSMKCVGFIATLQRGAEWAATGKVTVAKPEDFPTADKVSKREAVAQGAK